MAQCYHLLNMVIITHPQICTLTHVPFEFSESFVIFEGGEIKIRQNNMGS